MLALFRILLRGVALGGIVALLWRLLGSKQSRTDATGVLMEGARAILFLGARLYSTAAVSFLSGIYRAIAEDVTSEARTGELIELGSGPGLLAVEIGERARDLNVTTMEGSPHYVQVAEARIHGAGLGRQVKVALGEPDDIPFLDESCDYAVSFGQLHRWARPEMALSEMYRLLKPGGKGWIYDFRSDMPGEGWDLVRDKVDPLMRPVFDAVVVAEWKASLTDGQINAAVAASPFSHAEIGVLTVDVAGMRVPAVTRVVLAKE